MTTVKTVTMRVLADAGDAQSRLDEIAAKGDEIDHLDVRLRVSADDADAKAKLDSDMAAVDRLGAKDARIRVTVDDGGTKEKLAEDKAAADAAGKSLSDSAGGGGGALGPILMWGSLAGIIAGVAPALVAAGMGAGAFGALAYPAVSKVKTAYQGLSTAQQAYQTALAKDKIDPSKTNASAVTSALDNLKVAQKQIAGLPVSEQAAVKGIQNLVSEFGKLSTAFQPQAFAVFAGGLKVISGLLPSLTPLASGFAKAMTGVEESMGKGIASSGFQTFMKTMTGMVGPATTAIFGLAGSLTGVLGHALTTLAPMSVPFVNMLSKIVTGLGPSISNILKTLVTALSGVGQVIQPLLGPLGQLTGTLSAAFGQVVKAAAPQLAGLAGAIGKVAVALSPLISAAGKIAASFAPVIGTVAKLVGGLTPLAAAIGKAAGPIADAFATAMAKAAPSLDQLAGSVGKVAAALVPLVPALANMAVAFIGMAPAGAKIVAAIAQVVAAIAPAIAKIASLGASIIDTAASFNTASGRIVGAVVGAIAQVISTMSGVAGKIASVFANSVTWLYNAGKNIIEGLIRGIESMGSPAVSAAQHIGSSILGAVTGFLGIHSPSKKMITIGQQTIAGLLIGLQGGQSAVSAAATAMGNAVAGPDSAITGAIAKLRAYIPKGDTGLNKWLNAQNTKLQGLAARRGVLEQEIQQSEQVAQQAIQAASIMNAPGAATATPADPVTTQQVVSGMQIQAQQAKAFAQQIMQLQKMGLNATSLSQIIQGGAASGLPIAQAITSGGKTAVSQLNQLQQQVHDSASKLGDAAGPAMYQAGVDAAKGLAAGLKSQLSAVDAAMEQLAQSIVNTIKKKLKISSPSRVMADEVGRMIPAGVATGVDEWAHLAAGASSRLAASTVQPWSRGGGAAGGGGDIHVHFNGVVGDATAAARQVVQVLKQYKRNGGGAALGIG